MELWIYIYGLFIIIWTVIWIVTLIKQAKESDWVWFVLTLLINVLLVPYWIYKKFIE